ncbi:hypothetical protein IMCC14465_01610 [alpha proteobacterium IMCC14465]|uniref:Uncharacterized protein n=1 Tax=alpha proteobacterium IMCC14465 TaxID=1220535 RepID=J9DXL0_9PROT|nr:hypothetical protein IMCC14465_01610 [alpha proteobacterium IMCC14465]
MGFSAYTIIGLIRLQALENKKLALKRMKRLFCFSGFVIACLTFV